MVTAAQIKTIAGNRGAKHAVALANAVDKYEPHVQAQVLAQVMHETGGLVYDKEIWGPTKAQQGYEGRKDLGNTQKGDGSKFRGYGLIQVTGRANTTAFYKWCVKGGMNPPAFVDEPQQMAEDPWAAWTVVWYWEVKGLTKYADVGDIEMITRKVNGGLNGYDDRLRFYDRAALVLLGYGVNDIRKFQQNTKGLTADGVSGPRTRAALHTALLRKTQGAVDRQDTAAAPVVETVTQTEAVAVTPPSADAPWWKSKETIVPLIAGGGGTTVAGALGSAGNMPTANLIVIVVTFLAVLAAAGIVLYVMKKKDAKIVEAKVAALQGTRVNVS